MFKLKSNTKCLITGSNGFLGHHLINQLKKKRVKIIRTSSKKYDLRNFDETIKLLKNTKPEVIFNLAAKVGGILDNKIHPADFFFDNLKIIANIFEASSKTNVKKIINIGAGCGYPLDSKEPLEEKDIFSGLPQYESLPYSMSKKMIFVGSVAYRRQYGLSSSSIIPSNLYGEFDNFNLETSHVIPALIRKFYEAQKINKNFVEIWGTGKAKRDFVHAKDVAKSLIFLCENNEDLEPVNICSGKQISIKQVASILKKISNFKGGIKWISSKPEGQKSRQFSTIRMKKIIGKKANDFIQIEEGLKLTYNWFKKNYNSKNIRL